MLYLGWADTRKLPALLFNVRCTFCPIESNCPLSSSKNNSNHYMLLLFSHLAAGLDCTTCVQMGLGNPQTDECQGFPATDKEHKLCITKLWYGRNS